MSNTSGTRRALITGYYGFGNLGDEAILSSMLVDLRALRPELTVTVISGDPSATARQYQVEAVHWQDIPAIANEVKRAHLVVIGGGGLFQDYWGVKLDNLFSQDHGDITFYVAPLLLAALVNTPAMLYALGVGPLTTADGCRLVRAACEAAAAVTVRDPGSRQALIEAGVAEDRIVVTADPAFALQPAAVPPAAVPAAEGPLLAVILRPWRQQGSGVCPEQWQPQVAAALDLFLEREGGQVLFIPFQYSCFDHENDRRCAEQVHAIMALRHRATVQPGEHDPAGIAAVIAGCDLVLAMRLHGIIFAITGGVPVVALAYDPKVDNLMTRIGLDNRCLGLQGLEASPLADLLGDAWQHRSEQQLAQRTAARELADLARTTAGIAADLLATDIPGDTPLARGPAEVIARSFFRLLAGTPPGQDTTPSAAMPQSGEPSRPGPPATVGVDEVAARVRASRGAVILLRTIDWGHHLFQRPHHLARALARHGFVAVFDTGGMGAEDGFTEVEPNLFVYRGPQAVLREIPDPILWSVTYNFNQVDLLAGDGAAVVYDWIDDLSVFDFDAAFLQENHQRALAEADVVTTVARHLYREAVTVRPDTLYLPNGVDYDHFARQDLPLPDDPQLQAALQAGNPVAGYYGAMAEWFDYDLLGEAARLRPDWTFLLIGPEYSALSQQHRQVLELANVFWIGPRSYFQLNAYLQLFDVATIPFRINDITMATSPIKLYEYFAAGKPVATTPMPECMAYPEVEIFRTAAELSAALDRCRQRAASPELGLRLQAIARESSWSARIAEALKQLALRSTLSSAAAPAAVALTTSADTAALVQELSSHRLRAQELERVVAIRQQEVADRAQQVHRLQAEVEGLTRRLQELRSAQRRQVSLQEELSQAGQRHAALEAEVEALRTSNQELRHARAQERTRAGQLQKELEELRRSSPPPSP